MSRKQLSSQALTVDQMKLFVAEESDFSFELKALQIAKENGYQCEHGGLYTDPLTGKQRQFDIRAQKTVECEGDTGLREYLSIECKNLRDNNPLLVSCVQIDKDSTLDIYSPLLSSDPSFQNIFIDMNLVGTDIGRSVTQVGVAEHDQSFIASQQDSYPKISQAMSSAVELVERGRTAKIENKHHVFSDVSPMLVVPDGTLWKVVYDNMGDIVEEPYVTKAVDFYFGQRVALNGEEDGKLSHYLRSLKIVELSSLKMYLPSQKISQLKRQFNGESVPDLHMYKGTSE